MPARGGLARGAGRALAALLALALAVAGGRAAGAAARTPGAPAAADAVNAAPARWEGDTAAAAVQPPPRALAAALDALACARARGVTGREGLLTLIDYSLPSTAPRLWVLDVERHRVLFHELVAHGAGSGDNYATHFSNLPDSRQTSLGLFLTGATYQGGNGYSLRLRGLDPGVNDLAEARSIVMHGAWYVSSEHVKRFGRLGRSWGCPALPQEVAASVIDAIKEGSFVYAYAAETPATAAVPASAREHGGCPLPPADARPVSPAALAGTSAARSASR